MDQRLKENASFLVAEYFGTPLTQSMGINTNVKRESAMEYSLGTRWIPATSGPGCTSFAIFYVSNVSKMHLHEYQKLYDWQ